MKSASEQAELALDRWGLWRGLPGSRGLHDAVIAAIEAAVAEERARCIQAVKDFVPLDRRDGSQIWFGDGVSVEPAPDTAAPGMRSTVIVNGVPHYVRESVEEVLRAFGHEVGDPRA